MSHSHNHSHGHGHHHHHVPQQFNKAFAVAIVLNLAFVFIEAIYAVIAHSMALLADAGHNLGDVLGLVMAWIAAWLLTRPGSSRFSYGYRRTSILTALINALVLIATCAIIAYESIIKLVHPVAVKEPIIIVVALIGVVINGVTAMMFMKGAQDDLNIKGAFLHLASDALVSFGVVIAAIIILFTGWLRLDPIVGLLIVVVILAGTWGVLRDSLKMVLDAVPSHIDLEKVRNYLLDIPGVESIHDLHIWALSTQNTALTAHLVMPKKQLTDKAIHKINDELLHQFKIDHATIQVESGDGAHPCLAQCDE